MATSIAKLAAQLQLDSTQFKAGLDQAASELDSFGARANRTFDTGKFSSYVNRKYQKATFKEASEQLLFDLRGGGAGLGMNKYEEFRRERQVQRAFNVARYGSVGGGIMNMKESMGMMAAGPVGMAAAAVTAAVLAAGKLAMIADPASADAFHTELTNAAGALGTAFVPLLQAATGILHDLNPILHEMGETIGAALKDIIAGVKEFAGWVQKTTGRNLMEWISPAYGAYKAAKEAGGGSVDAAGYFTAPSNKAASLTSLEGLAEGNWTKVFEGHNLVQIGEQQLAALQAIQGALAGAGADAAARDGVNRGLQGAPS